MSKFPHTVFKYYPIDTIPSEQITSVTGMFILQYCPNEMLYHSVLVPVYVILVRRLSSWLEKSRTHISTSPLIWTNRI